MGSMKSCPGCSEPPAQEEHMGLVCLPEIAENKGRILQVFDFEPKTFMVAKCFLLGTKRPENPQMEYTKQKTPNVKPFGCE